MRMRSYLLLLIVLLVAAVPAMADSFTDASIFVTGSVTSTTVTLTFTCTSQSCDGWYLGDVTLKGFTFAGSPTLGTAPSGYIVDNGGQNNGSVAGGGGCNSTQPGQAVCWEAPATLTTRLDKNHTVTFTAHVTNGVAGSVLHFQATAYNNPQGNGTSGGKVWAASDDLTGGTTNTHVPEPNTLSLFAVGLGCLAEAYRRNRLKR